MLNITSYEEKYLKDIIKFDELYLTSSFKDLNLGLNDKIFVALFNNEFVGFIYFTHVLDEIDIVSIAVLSKYRRQGIARKLLIKMFEEYKPKRVFLEVKSNNLAARYLYKKLKFNDINVRKNYYSDHSDAIVMKWSEENGCPWC